MKITMVHFGMLAGMVLSLGTSAAQAADQPITGTGTVNYVPKYKGTYAVGNSQIVDNGTNVGVGTASPGAALHVYGASTAKELRLESGAATTYLHLRSNQRDFEVINDPAAAAILIRGGIGDKIGLELNASDVSKQLYLATSGNVGIGTNAPTAKLEVEGSGDTRIRLDATSGSGSGVLELASGPYTNFVFTEKSANGGHLLLRTDSTRHVLLQSGGGTTGNVGIGTAAPSEKLQVNGNVKANNFYMGAAARQKNDILPLDNAAGRLDCLSGVSYRAKGAKGGEESQIGLIGEDVEACFPELVATDAEGEKTIDYARLVVPLIEAAKEQQLINQELEARLARIEARVK